MNNVNIMNSRPKTVNMQAWRVIEELKDLLGRIQVDIDVPRDKVKAVVQRGHNLADTPENWPGGSRESQEFLKYLESLEQKINRILDLKALKDAGLLQVVAL